MFCVPAAKVLMVYINGEDDAINDLLKALEGDIQGKNERYLMILRVSNLIFRRTTTNSTRTHHTCKYVIDLLFLKNHDEVYPNLS